MSQRPPWEVGPPDLGDDLAKIRQQWGAVGDILADPTLFALRDASVSAWSCGEQAGHIVLTAGSIARAIAGNLAEPDRHSDGAPADFTGQVFEAGRLPRGWATAPPQLDATGRPAEDLRRVLPEVVAAWESIDRRRDEVRACAARAHHFAFGWLTSAEWVRMCAIHTAHHLAIVRDIRGQTGGSP